MSSRKQQLLDQIVQYLLGHGVASLSLRPLADAVGTSPRMLMFHFKSKERLLQEVMQEVNRTLQQKLEFLSAATVSARRVAPLKLFWEWATRSDNLPYFRLLYEAQIVAAQNPAEYAASLTQASQSWRELALLSMSHSLREQTLADLCIAVFDGLLLEFIVTGEKRRLTQALDRFIAILRKSANGSLKRRKEVR